MTKVQSFNNKCKNSEVETRKKNTFLTILFISLWLCVPQSHGGGRSDTLWIGGGFGANWRHSDAGFAGTGLVVSTSCRFRVSAWLDLGIRCAFEESLGAVPDHESRRNEIGSLYSYPMTATVLIEFWNFAGMRQFVSCGLGMTSYTVRSKGENTAAGNTLSIPIGLVVRSPGGSVSVEAEARYPGTLLHGADLGTGGTVYSLKIELQFPVLLVWH
jgi:hypothetical protein